MRERLGKWWPVLKILLGLAILFFIGRSLGRDLMEPELWQHSYNPLWLILAGLLYLLGLGCTMLFWGLLLWRSGQRPTVLGLLRGYYVGLLGKYAPGKAWALLLRATFVRPGAVRPAVAVQTGFYEVMMMMASAGTYACLLFAITAPVSGAGLHEHALGNVFRLSVPEDMQLGRSVLVLFAAILAVPFLTIAFPPLFNRVVSRVSGLVARYTNESPPRIDMAACFYGLLIEAGCWACMGVSLWLTLDAVYPGGADWSWTSYGYVTAATALACVAGFVIILVPSGLGVREYLLIVFLRPYFPGPATALAVIVLRIIWTVSEAAMGGGLYLVGRRATKVE